MRMAGKINFLRPVVWALTAALAALCFRATAGEQASPQRAILERYATRFSTEVYPLMERKVNGCKACHGPSTPRMFQVFDTAKATFSLVIERDLLNQQDPMFILQRLAAKDPELHMPKVGVWSASELDREEVQSAVLRLKSGHSRPLPDDPRQLAIF